jgi:AmmeMemoRadiSam system protein A
MIPARPETMGMNLTCGEQLPGIARQAVESGLRGTAESPPAAAEGYLSLPRAVFVTLFHRAGELRGCVGTLTPKCRDVVRETWQMAREAAFSDQRFPPVVGAELATVWFEVSVLHPLEGVASPQELDPRCFGVVVRTADGRRGALLPGIAEIHSADEQLELARRKGGIQPWETVRIERFRVEKFREPGPPG